MTRPTTPRRAFLAAAVATAAAVTAPRASAAPGPAGSRTSDPATGATTGYDEAPVDHHSWTTTADWRTGTAEGVRTVTGARPGIAIARAAGTYDYTDPHTGRTATWEKAVWTSPVHTLPHPATELVASWNADTPAGTWIQTELSGTYSDGTSTPWYVMGRWTADDSDASIRRTSLDDQSDGRSSIWTDTFSIDTPTLPDGTPGLRLVSYRLRLTLLRTPGTDLTPTVRRIGAMASDIPDRFTVPASVPGEGTGIELPVPRYSQEIHKGQYPQYDNGGEAWCSPTSSEMVVEHWGRGPTREQLAWVDPAYADPQVCHAARYTYDYQYTGCGNWPFNAAYAATFHGISAVVTRLRTLNDVEKLIRAGIPVITSQSFLAAELDGAGYGTAGHLMCVVGFTPEGDVIANDPASADDAAVRRVYKRSQFETVWLRTKRYNADGQVRSGSGGVCYVYWPTDSTPSQYRALRDVGIR
jgi:hypothetical protein